MTEHHWEIWYHLLFTPASSKAVSAVWPSGFDQRIQGHFHNSAVKNYPVFKLPGRFIFQFAGFVVWPVNLDCFPGGRVST